MKNKLFRFTVLCSLAMILISGILFVSSQKVNTEDEKANMLVALNEISKLNDRGDYEKANEKISALQEHIRKLEQEKSGGNAIPILCVISILFFITAFAYIQSALFCPFEKMKDFALKISLGDFSVPLKYERSNYFGEFTWAFDSMRNEITKARASEKEAIENNKTVIATLSHDIKTPIASIRAYSEGLSANMDSSYEKREKYLSVIRKKCDEVSRLTDDLFLHSVSDMDKLKMNPERTEICSFTENIINEISAEQGDVNFKVPGYAVFLNTDRNRFAQLCENLINNARKYARTDIDVFFSREEENIVLHFRDYGGGIPDENMPFIFDKFYRGNNCGSQQGSGLGLYIVKYIAEKMDGKVLLQNHGAGLEVKIILPVRP